MNLFIENGVYHYYNFIIYKEIKQDGSDMKIFTKQEELLLLAVFSIKDGAYLVNIRDFLLDRTGRDWALGSLYLALDRLIKNGYLTTYLGEPGSTRGGKAIKYYKLTESGRIELEKEKKQWMSIHKLLAKLWEPVPGL